MSRKSRAAYYAALERVYSHCENRHDGRLVAGRYSAKDGRTLCPTCRRMAKLGEKVDFSCCGGNDGHPKDHCMDCSRWEHVWVKLGPRGRGYYALRGRHPESGPTTPAAPQGQAGP